MIWFKRNKKRHKKNDNPLMSLEEFKVKKEDLEWLKWKYKNLRNHSFKATCLLCYHVVEPNCTEKEATEEKQEFLDGIRNKPDRRREYINQKTGTHLLWVNKRLIRKNSERFDLVSFKNTINQIQQNSMLKQTYWAYIYKLVADGVLGSNKKGISVDSFREMMKGITSASRNAYYDYMPRGTYPDYLPTTNELKKYNQKVVDIKNFVQSFVNRYYENLNLEVSIDNVDAIM